MMSYVPWIVFGFLIVAVFVVDLKFVNKNPHKINIKESLFATLGINIVAVIFGVYVLMLKGGEAGMQFFTGYIIEYSLSVDNLFVFLVLFSMFKIPDIYRHRVLFWGIMFAIFARAAFIISGVAIVNRFHWVVYLLGLFLMYTGIKLFFKKEDDDAHIMDGKFFKYIKKLIPMTKELNGEKFFVRIDGKLLATPLFMTLIFIELIDIAFAFDSVPAILTISRDPFVIFTSNIFAILGLRSLYFALAGVMNLFHYLHYGLAVILTFIGTKILIEEYFHIPIAIALGVVVCVLAASVLLSMLKPPRGRKEIPAEDSEAS